MNTYTIRYNRATNHISGLNIRTKGSEMNYAQNACGSITRGGLADGKTFDNVVEALEAARKAGGRKLCKKCEAAAQAMLVETVETVTVLVDVVESSRALISIQGGPAGMMGKDGREWWAEDTYESGMIVARRRNLRMAAEAWARAMGIDAPFNVKIDYEYR